ncbi:hypothetical protein [Sinorhizobium sp. 22678]|uniref:hypothetical protein n=1 Tax=Sinorhizobium sp. 22678 TaxID=3453955 RepID=UPI003F87ED21
MTYQVLKDDGAPLDAHLELEGVEFVFHSRGGKRGQPGARNLDYGPALRLLLQRIANAGLRLDGAWIDSDEVLHLPREQRIILDGEDLTSDPLGQFRVMSARMQSFGRPADAPYGGSRVKKVRVRLGGVTSAEELAFVLGLKEVPMLPRAHGRLPAQLLDAITAEHVWEAVQWLAVNQDVHPFGEARDFDLIADDGIRLPPKAVFGLAAKLALGREILPEHFTGGIASRCHRTLQAAGFEIARRGAPVNNSSVPVSNDDREWAEGRPKLLMHLKRERAPGLSRAKKVSFIRRHGRLYCERCGLDPIEVFGAPVGEACIEVHHSQTRIGDMGEGGRTKLSDLQCLCADCHRVVQGRRSVAVRRSVTVHGVAG